MSAASPRPFDYRRLFWKWHKFAGLFGGPLLILIAVTGGILVFGPEIDAWLRPDLWKINAPGGPEANTHVPDQQLIDTVREGHPGMRVLFYRQGNHPAEPYHFWLIGKPGNGLFHVWMNPYDGTVVGERHWESAFIRIVEQLHRRLLSGEIGSSIVEWMTGWGIVLALTGCYMWWPRTLKAMWHNLTLSLRGSAYKVNWRLHNTLGAWTGLFILLMCLTGMVFSTYSGRLYHMAMEATGGSNMASNPAPKSQKKPGDVPVAVDLVLAKVHSDIPAKQPLTVNFSAADTGCLVVSTNREARPVWGHWSDFRSWTFDQYSGELIESRRWSDLHPLAQFWTVSLSIHYGSIFGLPTKLIALVSCLAIPVLSITGVMIWWWKRAGKRQAATRTSTQSAVRTVRESRPISKGLVATLIVVGIIFPTIGVSYLMLISWEVIGYLWQRWQMGNQPTPAGHLAITAGEDV